MKINKYLAWALVILPSLVMLASSVFKFFPNEEARAGMAGTGYEPHLALLGVVEILVTVLFIVPATRRVGFYLVCSYLGGAMAVHIQKNISPLMPAIILALFWVAAYFTLPLFLPARSAEHASRS